MQAKDGQEIELSWADGGGSRRAEQRAWGKCLGERSDLIAMICGVLTVREASGPLDAPTSLCPAHPACV